MKLKKVNLDIKNYNSIHYYGKLVWYDTKRHAIELEYRLDKEQAYKFNYLELGAYKPYKEGDKSVRFSLLSQLYAAGIKECLLKLGKSTILFVGDSACASPQMCLYAPKESLKNALNEVYEKAKSIGWYSGGHKKEMYELDDEWEDLFDEWEIER